MIFYIRNAKGEVLEKARSIEEAIEKMRKYKYAEVQII